MINTLGSGSRRKIRAAAGVVRALALVGAGEVACTFSISWTIRLGLSVLVLLFLQLPPAKIAHLSTLPHARQVIALLIVQSIIGCLLLAPMLAILTGSRSAKSPLAGYLAACAGLTAALVWGVVPLVWQQYADAAIGQPLPRSYGPQYSAGMLLWQIGLTFLFSVVADQLRTSTATLKAISATAFSVVAFMLFALVFKFVAPFLVVGTTDPNAAVHALSVIPAMAVPLWCIATWLLLIRMREARQVQHAS